MDISIWDEVLTMAHAPLGHVTDMVSPSLLVFSDIHAYETSDGARYGMFTVLTSVLCRPQFLLQPAAGVSDICLSVF